MFDGAEDFVADGAAVAEGEDMFALGVDQLAVKLAGALHHRVGFLVGGFVLAVGGIAAAAGEEFVAVIVVVPEMRKRAGLHVWVGGQLFETDHGNLHGAETHSCASQGDVSSSASSPRMRMSQGRERLWTTSVKRMTAKVRKMIRFRRGNGAGGGDQWKCQCGCERVDAAHSGEGDEKNVLPGRRGIAFAEGGDEPAGQIAGGEDPDDSDDHDHQAEDQGVDDAVAGGVGGVLLEDVSHLQADEDEDQAIEEERDDVPDGDGGDARSRGEEMGAARLR